MLDKIRKLWHNLLVGRGIRTERETGHSGYWGSRKGLISVVLFSCDPTDANLYPEKVVTFSFGAGVKKYSEKALNSVLEDISLNELKVVEVHVAVDYKNQHKDTYPVSSFSKEDLMQYLAVANFMYKDMLLMKLRRELKILGSR